MDRQTIIEEITKSMGSVPDWLNGIPDPMLEHVWGMTNWFLNDSKLSGRDKALVAFGAASATHCPY